HSLTREVSPGSRRSHEAAPHAIQGRSRHPATGNSLNVARCRALASRHMAATATDRLTTVTTTTSRRVIGATRIAPTKRGDTRLPGPTAGATAIAGTPTATGRTAIGPTWSPTGTGRMG